jgi:hypothetical protein
MFLLLLTLTSAAKLVHIKKPDVLFENKLKKGSALWIPNRSALFPREYPL